MIIKNGPTDENQSKKDYSLLNCSKLVIRSFEEYDLQRELKKYKYPTYSISNAEDLEGKIQSFKDDNVKKQLKKSLVQLNSYRKVRGDGNCFFRALAFSCISTAAKPSLKSCFPYIQQVCLTCCRVESIPADLRKFYQHYFLFKMLQKWQTIYSNYLNQCQNNPRKALIKMFDQYPYLDFIVILYFRAFCLKALWALQTSLKQFLIGKQQQYIRTYGEQTQGVVINLCSIMLKLIINVYEIRVGLVKIYRYDTVKQAKGEIHLLFYENHYDIIQKNEQIQAEKNSLSTNSNYYSDVSKKTVKGTCIECNKQREVYQDSAVCISCFDVATQAAKRYDGGGKLKRARCSDCQHIKDDVVEDVGICKQCIDEQNKIAERKKKQQQKKKQEQQRNAKRVRGKCFQCYYTQYLDDQTGMCDYCTKSHKKAMNRIQNNQQIQRQRQRQKQRQKQRQRQKQKFSQKLQQSSHNPQQNDPKNGIQPDQNTDQKYKLKTSSPSKIRKDNNEYMLNSKQTAQTTAKKYSYTSPSKTNINVKQCQNCKTYDLLADKSLLCIKCFKQMFSEQNYCNMCRFKQYLHNQKSLCSQCYQMSRAKPKPANQRGNQIIRKQLNKCMKCYKGDQYKQRLCLQCFNNSYCRNCHMLKYTQMIVRGLCTRCRPAGHRMPNRF